MASISSLRFRPRSTPVNSPAGQKRLFLAEDGLLKTIDDAGNVAAVADGTGLPEAPSDGKTYGRKDAGWVEAGGAVASTDITDSTAAGRSMLTAADAAEQRTLIGAVYPTMLFPSGQNIIGDIPTDWGNGTHDTTLIFGNAVTAIGGAVFNYCASLTGTLIIPSTVITVGPSAFGGCAFTELTIPNSVAILGDGAFNSMGYLTRVNCYVTKTIIDSGYGMFESIGSLTLHARASDATWTAGTGLTVGECYNVTVIKDL